MRVGPIRGERRLKSSGRSRSIKIPLIFLSGHELRECGQTRYPCYYRLAVQIWNCKPPTGDGEFSDLSLACNEMGALQPKADVLLEFRLYLDTSEASDRYRVGPK